MAADGLADGAVPRLSKTWETAVPTPATTLPIWPVAA
jgi:hypothetical protein